jgi:Asp-tRNA(Asn)/Glu-tRNA(Gln) amidotransferase A subunit family amidase
MDDSLTVAFGLPTPASRVSVVFLAPCQFHVIVPLTPLLKLRIRGRSVSDVELAAKMILNQTVEEHARVMAPGVIPLPWRKVAEPKKEKTRIGYYKTDGFIKTSPACQRAVQETVDALRRDGWECIEFEPPDSESKSLFPGGVTLTASFPSQVVEALRIFVSHAPSELGQ